VAVTLLAAILSALALAVIELAHPWPATSSRPSAPTRAALANSGTRLRNGSVIADTPYTLPSYSQAKGVDYFASQADYDRAVNDSSFVLRRLTYASGGLKVSGYLYRPAQTAGRKLPVIVYNRGGYLVSDLGHVLLPFFHRLASEGFVVFAPLLRESDGAEGRDEVGGADLEDLMSVVPLLGSLPYADSKNLFLYGESRGGMMTFQAIRDGFPAKAAATFGAFTDLEAYLASAPEVEALSRKIMPDYDTRRAEVVGRRSAVAWVDRLSVPLLLMHGGADKSVDPSHTLSLAQALNRTGKQFELVIFAGDNHVLRLNQVERDARAVAWFKRHLA
jgi:dipeptidyl aminopeptidase/acylaminoacyl peptidase